MASRGLFTLLLLLLALCVALTQVVVARPGPLDADADHAASSTGTQLNGLAAEYVYTEVEWPVGTQFQLIRDGKYLYPSVWKTVETIADPYAAKIENLTAWETVPSVYPLVPYWAGAVNIRSAPTGQQLDYIDGELGLREVDNIARFVVSVAYDSSTHLLGKSIKYPGQLRYAPGGPGHYVRGDWTFVLLNQPDGTGTGTAAAAAAHVHPEVEVIQHVTQ